VSSRSQRSQRLSGRAAFPTIAVGQTASAFGSSLTLFAIAWTVWSEYRSGSALAVLWILVALVYVIAGPFAGVYVDRWDRRTTMLGADIFSACIACAAALAIAVDGFSLFGAYAIVLGLSAARIFHGPAFAAAIPLLVPDRHLGRANGVVEFSHGGSRLAAPAIGGLLLAAGLDLRHILLLDALTFALAAVSLALVRVPQVPAHESRDAATSWLRGLTADVSAGFRYVWTRRGLFWLLMLFATVNLLGSGINVLLPQIVTLKFDAGSGLFGAMEAAMGAGVLVGALVMIVWAGPRSRVAGILIGLAIGAFFQLATGLVPWAPAAVIALGCAVTAWLIVNTIQTSLFQTAVAPGMQGRVFALRRTLEQFTWPVSSLAAGLLSPTLVRPDVLLALGGVAMLVAVAVAASSPSVRALTREWRSNAAGTADVPVTAANQLARAPEQAQD